MIIDADRLAGGIDALNQYLTEGVITVAFVKKDGTDRAMKCTKRMDLIPEANHPKPKLPTDLAEVFDPQLFKVWDIDKQGWRSFRYTTVKTIALDK
jgi:hypothetical protein